MVPAVKAKEMREVDRIAVEEFGLGILQMVENAGRNLAQNVLTMLDSTKGEVTILAGSGGNGGGGVCCARHLHNRGFKVWVVLDKEAATLTEAAHSQFHILQPAGLEPTNPSQAGEVLHRSQVVMDALIGYGLQGLPRGNTAELIGLCNEREARVLSLDVPSGLDATTGEARGVVMCPERILTLALPKTGLHSVPGELYLADIGIPPGVFRRLGLCFKPPFKESYCLPLVPVPRDDSPVLSGLDDQDLQRRDEMR